MRNNYFFSEWVELDIGFRAGGERMEDGMADECWSHTTAVRGGWELNICGVARLSWSIVLTYDSSIWMHASQHPYGCIHRIISKDYKFTCCCFLQNTKYKQFCSFPKHIRTCMHVLSTITTVVHVPKDGWEWNFNVPPLCHVILSWTWELQTENENGFVTLRLRNRRAFEIATFFLSMTTKKQATS